jgi:hypothetical protein
VTESRLWVIKTVSSTQVHEVNTRQEIFSHFGHVRRVRYNPADQIAFIAYLHISDARTAVMDFDNSFLHDQNMRVLRSDRIQSADK